MARHRLHLSRVPCRSPGALILSEWRLDHILRCVHNTAHHRIVYTWISIALGASHLHHRHHHHLLLHHELHLLGGHLPTLHHLLHHLLLLHHHGIHHRVHSTLRHASWHTWHSSGSHAWHSPGCHARHLLLLVLIVDRLAHVGSFVRRQHLRAHRCLRHERLLAQLV